MSVCPHLSTASKHRHSRASDEEYHTDVLRDILNKSFHETDEASDLNTKIGPRFHGSLNSREMRQSDSTKGYRGSMSLHSTIQQSANQPTRTYHMRYSAQSERSGKEDIPSTGSELVRSHISSCSSSIPQNWTSTHERFIAYLATHAPLAENGKIPAHEEFCNIVEILKMVKERFPRLGGQAYDLPHKKPNHRLKADAVEMRLALLDQAGDNGYFDLRYGAYNSQ